MLDVPRSAEDWEALFDLRWRVLRAPWGQPRGSERDEFEESADHVLWRDEAGRIVAAGRLQVLPDGSTGRIRYMAVDPSCQGRGLGGLVLTELEACARRRGLSRIALMARTSAERFYSRRGYATVAEGPVAFGSVPHVRMERSICAEVAS